MQIIPRNTASSRPWLAVNRRCECVNVGLLCSYVCIDCENHDRESDGEDTSDSKIVFSDSDSDWRKINDPIILPGMFT